MAAQPLLITVADAAKMMGCSRGTLYRMFKAREYEAKIAAGDKTVEDVPADVRPYLGCGFPPKTMIGPQMPRLNKAQVEEWIAGRGKV